MDKRREVGKIVNDEACFLNVNFAATIQTGEINIDLEYDKRIIKNKNKLTKITNEYLEKVEKIMSEDLKENAE